MRKRSLTSRVLILLTLLLLAGSPTFISPTTSRLMPPDMVLAKSEGLEEISFLAYNLFLRPPPVGSDDATDCRAEAFIQAIEHDPNRPDVLALSETFYRPDAEKIVKRLSKFYPYSVSRVPQTGSLLRINGGLTLLSKYPIEAFEAEAFHSCGGEYHDCLATKGVLFTRIALREDFKIDVYLTHMDAGYSAADVLYRSQQRQQFLRFKDRYSDGQWPVVFLGDMNVNGLRSSEREYLNMISDLGEPLDLGQGIPRGEASTLNCNMSASCTHEVKPERLDYIFAYQHPRYQIQALRVEHRANPHRRCGGGFISDHKALYATLTYKKAP